MPEFTAEQLAEIQERINASNAITQGDFRNLLTALNKPSKEKVRLGEISTQDPSEWHYFRARLLEAKALNKWTDQEAKQHLKIALTGEAAAVTQDIKLGGDPTVADAPNKKTFDEYLKAVGLRFVSKASGRLAVSQYRKRVQKPTESVLTFHGDLRRLKDVADPNAPVDDPDIIRHFSEGILDEQVANYVLEKDPQTYQEALEFAQHKEGITAQRQLAVGRQRAMNRINAIDGEAEADGVPFVCPPQAPQAQIFAINYPYGSATPSSSDANKALRRNGNMPANPQNLVPFIGGNHPYYQSPYFGQDPSSSQRRRGRGGGRRGNGRTRGGGGGRGRGRNNNKNRRPFRQPGKKRVNAINEEKAGVNELTNLMASNTIDEETGQAQGNWGWPRD